ncbi:MAG: TIGR02449 family protein [Ectothiorhodospira sp.]
MAQTPHNDPDGQPLRDLESRVEALVQLCERLQEENRMLQQQNDQLRAERAALSERGEQARIKVESIISRLRSMEQAS